MQPAVHNFKVKRGDTYAFRRRLKAVAGDGTRTPIPLAGAEILLTLAWAGGTLRKSATGGQIVVNTGTGEVSYTFTPTETDDLPKGSFTSYELEVRSGSSRDTYLAGVITAFGGLSDD